MVVPPSLHALVQRIGVCVQEVLRVCAHLGVGAERAGLKKGALHGRVCLRFQKGEEILGSCIQVYALLGIS